MFESLSKLIGWLRTVPTLLRFIVIALVAALIAALSFTSCSRTMLKCHGTGDFDYEYRGKYVNNSSN